MFYRLIPIAMFIFLGSSCSSTLEPIELRSNLASPTPFAEKETPAEWKLIRMGQFSFQVPPDFKKREVRGIDSSVYLQENSKFTLDVETGMYGGHWPTHHSFEYQIGQAMIDGHPVKFIKQDFNKPAANAARNADGSTSKPVDKHLACTIYLPEHQATITVSYADETLTQVALSILQSIRIKE